MYVNNLNTFFNRTQFLQKLSKIFAIYYVFPRSYNLLLSLVIKYEMKYAPNYIKYTAVYFQFYLLLTIE